jgi:hypothetical protein
VGEELSHAAVFVTFRGSFIKAPKNQTYKDHSFQRRIYLESVQLISCIVPPMLWIIAVYGCKQAFSSA